ncbi:MAG: SoxR reducing system RseC family protein [Mangrovibacterium sp.]
MISGEITHEGIIKRIEERKITVGIVSQSSCASCHAKGACMASDTQEKELEIVRYSGDYRVGERVLVVGKTSQGFYALFYAYVLPFAILMTLLIIMTNLGKSEGFSAGVSLFSLIPYYLVLYAFRNKISRKLEFEIKSI